MDEMPKAAALAQRVLSRKCGFATFLDPRGGRPALAGLGALSGLRGTHKLRTYLDNL
jgi:hypothetical protein